MKQRSLLSSTALGLVLGLSLGGCGDDAASEDDDLSDSGQPSTADDAGASAGDASLDAAQPSLDATTPSSPAADAAQTDGSAPPGAGMAGSEGFLLVAELADGKESIHAYSLPDLRHTGQLDGVKLGNHVGALALRDGRVITTDDKNQQVIAVRMDAAGKPTIANRVAADLGTGGVWGCGDADLRYLAIASGREGTAPQVANVVSLSDFTNTPLEVPMNVIDGASEELHPAVAGNPLHLFAGVGGEVRAYPLDAVLARRAPAPVASVTINTGSHGPVVSHTRGVLYITAAAGTGFDGVMTQAPFARTELIPWDIGDRTTGRNSRPRLSPDGRYIYGAIARTEPAGAELWATREVDLQAVDLETRSPRRTVLTTGIVSRFQISRRYALFANVTAAGDFAILVDVEPGSSTFQQVVARIALPRLTNGPVAGQPTTGKEAHASAITPDGKWAFVSHGGEGKVSVIDTAQKRVVGTIRTPTTLAGGGYLFALQPGSAPLESCMR